MATIYRFIIEQKISSGGSGRTPRDASATKKTTAKKGRSVSFFGGDKGGVEHNRKMRALNPLFNRMTGGWWEKGMRLTRAGMGIVKTDKKTGKFEGFSGPAIAIIFAFVIQMLLKWQQSEAQKAQKMNSQNFKQLENGVGFINGSYSITTNFFTGRHTYNQNK